MYTNNYRIQKTFVYLYTKTLIYVNMIVERMLTMNQYIIEKHGGQKIAEGKVLSELIEYICLNQIHQIDKKFSTITKIEKDYYKYMNQLASIYNTAKEYAEAIKSAPCCLDNILEVYNQEQYIQKVEFINIKTIKEVKENA